MFWVTACWRCRVQFTTSFMSIPMCLAWGQVCRRQHISKCFLELLRTCGLVLSLENRLVVQLLGGRCDFFAERGTSFFSCRCSVVLFVHCQAWLRVFACSFVLVFAGMSPGARFLFSYSCSLKTVPLVSVAGLAGGSKVYKKRGVLTQVEGSIRCALAHSGGLGLTSPSSRHWIFARLSCKNRRDAMMVSAATTHSKAQGLICSAIH